MRRCFKPSNKIQNQQSIPNNDLIRIRGDFDTMRLSENTINYKYNDHSKYISINDKSEHKESLNKKKGLIKTKYAAYSSSISSLNGNDFIKFIIHENSSSLFIFIEKQLYFSSKSKKRKFISSNSSVKNPKKNQYHQNNHSNDKDWIDDLNMLGNFISIKDDNNIPSFNNNAKISEIKEIAKNADSLIEILQNLKRAVGDNKFSSENRVQDELHIDLDENNGIKVGEEVNEETTNNLDNLDREEIKIDNRDSQAISPQTNGEWW